MVNHKPAAIGFSATPTPQLKHHNVLIWLTLLKIKFSQITEFRYHLGYLAEARTGLKGCSSKAGKSVEAVTVLLIGT